MLKPFEKLNALIKKLELLKFGVAAILIVIPLYPKFPLFRIPGYQVSVRLEDFLLLLVSLIWLITELPRINKLLQDKVATAIMLFLAIALLATVSGIFLTKTVVLQEGLLHWVRRIEYMIPFFIGVSAMRSRQNLNFYIKCIAIVLVLAAIYGFGQRQFFWPVVTTQNFENSKGIAQRYTPGSHLVSTFAGHYDLASYLVFVLPLFFALLVRKIKSPKNIFLVPPLVSGLWMLVNTISRISVASYLINVTIALALFKKYLAIPIVIVASIIVFSLSGDLVDRYMRIIEVYWRQLTTYVSLDVQAARATPTPAPPPVFEDRSTSIRLVVEWPRAIRAFSKNPVLGTGLSSITLATDNDYLRLLGEVGLLGFASFFLIFGSLACSFLRSLPPKANSVHNVFVASMVGSVPGVLINAIFIDVFEASKFAIIFWLLIGMAYALAKNSK